MATNENKTPMAEPSTEAKAVLRGELTSKLEANAGKVRFRRWKNMSMGSRISVIVLAIVFLVAIFAQFISPYDPIKDIFAPNMAPDSEHIFGTDKTGYDVLSRMLHGARYSLVVGLGATAFALIVGSIVGSIAAVSRKWVSEVIMRLLDIIMSFPGIALATTFVIVFGRNIPSLIFAIGFLYIPQIARIVRANVVSEYGQDYVRAVIVSGARAPWILAKHVMRNCLAPILVFTIVLVADAIVFEASLSFLGAGIPEPMPTWGNILASAKDGVIFGRWWAALFPGLAIVITVLCLNILSEGVTDAMAAPKAAVKPSDSDLSGNREADRLVADPTLAYKAQAESLRNRLNQLKETEATRTDRFEARTDVPPILEVKNLCIKFPRHGDVNVVDHVSFVVRPRQTMGLVGESGCGKSITSLTVMGLLDKKAQVSGEILYDGKNLLTMSEKEINELRGREIAMVYQDALSSLNPSMLIRAQMKQLTKRGGTRTAEELLELVGLDPKRTLDSYPHELSGGQRQRVLIAMALTRDPKVIIADEPTTALDVTVQKQVIDLLNKLQKELGFAMVFVSHDLALVAEVANSITVMYAGQVVEQGPVRDILMNPIHEYTRGLLGSVLSIEAGGARLHQIPGSVPSPADFPKGDRFTPRSSHPDAVSQLRPVLKQLADSDHYYAELPDSEMKKLGLTPYSSRHTMTGSPKVEPESVLVERIEQEVLEAVEHNLGIESSKGGER